MTDVRVINYGNGENLFKDNSGALEQKMQEHSLYLNRSIEVFEPNFDQKPRIFALQEVWAALSNPLRVSKTSDQSFRMHGLTKDIAVPIPKDAKYVNLSKGALIDGTYWLSERESSNTIETLDISRNQLMGVCTKEGGLKNLKKLNASINTIVYAPQLDKLESLEECDLSYNKGLFGGAYNFSLPQSLQKLNLAYTEYSLGRSGGKLSSAVGAMNDIPNLQELDFSGNRLSFGATLDNLDLPFQIPFKNLSQEVKEKLVQEEQFKFIAGDKSIDKHNESTCITIKQDASPEKLDKIGSTLIEEFKSSVLERYPKEFGFPSSLKVLYLADTNIDSKDFKYLHNLQNLEVLDLSYTNITNVDDLRELLEQLPKLKKLKLHLNFSNINGSFISSETIVECMAKNREEILEFVKMKCAEELDSKAVADSKAAAEASELEEYADRIQEQCGMLSELIPFCYENKEKIDFKVFSDPKPPRSKS